MQGIFYLAAIVAVVAIAIWFTRNANSEDLDSGYKGIFAVKRPEEQSKSSKKPRAPWSRPKI
jgi:hypothetical protein